MKRVAYFTLGAVSLLVAVVACAAPRFAPTAKPAPSPSLSRTTRPVQTHLPPSSTDTPYSTPNVPDGYEFFSDQELKISYFRPVGWDVERGTHTSGDTTIQFAEYSLKRKDTICAIYITRLPGSTPASISPEQLSELAKETFTADEVKIIEELHVSVDDRPATGITFKSSLNGMQFFGILLLTSASDMPYIFAWESFAESEKQMRDIYSTMLPRIKFMRE